MAFAGAVFRGQKQLGECPKLTKDVIDRYSDGVGNRTSIDADMLKVSDQLKQAIQSVNLSERAEKVGGVFANGKLTIKVMGKDFSVDANGNIYTDIHVHPWITIPFYNYILTCSGAPVTGKWVPFRELKNAQSWNSLYLQRCEKPLKRVADTYTDLFEDMIQIFNGRKVENHYESDISLVLQPFPKIPILICYWKPEEDLESSLNIFFDESINENLKIESVFTLSTGITRMFEKIALRHGIK